MMSDNFCDVLKVNLIASLVRHGVGNPVLLVHVVVVVPNVAVVVVLAAWLAAVILWPE